MDILTKLPHLRQINQKNSFQKIDFQNSNFFIIWSKCIEDIHKAIKYGVWTSFSNTNEKIYNQMSKYKKNIYFIFGCINKDQYFGVAKAFNFFDVVFDYWFEGGRFKGLFVLDWIYIKDLEFNKKFKYSYD